MEMTDCIVSSRKQYVQLTVRPGCEGEFGRVLRGQIGEVHHVLFENVEEVHDLERYFNSVPETKGTTHD